MDIFKLPTTPPKNVDRDELEDLTKDYQERIADQHQLLRANQDHSVLIVFQGMDAAGKDGAVKEVFKKCVHNDINVFSFKKPTDLEFSHDFLWRVHQKAPAKGEIAVFNRSHYEDVLIQRVHGWIDDSRVDVRFRAINAFEELLQADNNTLILKFFLNISYSEQEIQLNERLEENDKHWKHNESDWTEREHWDDYMHAYQDVLNRSMIPWTIVPVDKRWYRNYVICKAVCEALEGLKMEYPPLMREEG